MELNLDDFSIDNYDAYDITRGNRRCGGVVIYTANELSCNLVGIKSFALESILEYVTVELAIENHKHGVVSCMYRTPGSNLDTFSENVEHIFSDAKGMKTIFVCGDLNIDSLKHESHNSTRNFLDMMYSLGLYPLIDKPTRITDTSATLIDNIFTNDLHHNLTSGILFNDISDHLPIFALCEFNVTRRIVNGFQYIRTVNEDTFASLSSEVGQQSWENVVNTKNDANQA